MSNRRKGRIEAVQKYDACLTFDDLPGSRHQQWRISSEVVLREMQLVLKCDCWKGAADWGQIDIVCSMLMLPRIGRRHELRILGALLELVEVLKADDLAL